MTYTHLVDNKKKFTLIIFILGSIIAIAPITIDMYLPAFDAIKKDLNTTDSKLQLSLASYFVGMALSQIIYGPLVDRFGRKIPLFFGLISYIIISILCCFVTNIENLILLRFLQALGVCSCLVVPRAIVRDIFSPQESARVFSYLMLVVGVAPIFAPSLGSLLLLKFTWRSIFAFSAIFGLFCLILSILTLPITKGPNPEDRLSLAIKRYLGILKDRNFVVCSLSGGFAIGGLLSFVTGSPALYMDFFGLSSAKFSLLFSTNALFFVIASQLNAHFLKKISIEKILQITIFLPAIASIGLLYYSYYNPQLWLINLLLILFSSGIGAINPNTTAIAMANQSKHAGSASAMLGTIQFSIATILSFLISRFQQDGIMPFMIIISSCGFLSLLIFKLFYHKHVHGC